MTDQTLGAPEAPAIAHRHDLAGFGPRLGAYIIDYFLSLLLLLALAGTLKAPGAVLGLAASIAYFVIGEGGAKGQTPGKAACRIAVRSADDGGSIGYGRAFLRYIGAIISSIPLNLGFLWMLWDAENQTWHDKIANSVVVRV